MGSGRVLYLDLVGGAAGDMILAALVDAGASLDRVRATWKALGLEGVDASLEEAHPAGLRARRIQISVRGRPADSHDEARAEDDEQPHAHAHDDVDAHVHDHPHVHLHVHEGEGAKRDDHGARAKRLAMTPQLQKAIELVQMSREDILHAIEDELAHRRYRDIKAMLEAATTLDPRARAIALDAFRRLGEAEAHVHGVAIDEVEFHEVGSDDAIADITGVATAIAALDPDEVHVSPIPIGRGLTKGAHGPIPLPGPATLEILRGAPIQGVSLEGETVTPTGAALIAALATAYGPAPSMVLEATGVGAGKKQWPDRPNIVRAILGRRSPSAEAVFEDSVVEANIDDMTPEHLAALKRALFKAGAADVWSAPIAMKKDRTGVLVGALVRKNLVQVIASAFFVHSTTLGVRITDVARVRAARAIEEVETRFGKVRVKVAARPEGSPLVQPEYDDCERLAEAFGVPLREVVEAALFAAWKKRTDR